jgi:hypothetical protein
MFWKQLHHEISEGVYWIADLIIGVLLVVCIGFYYMVLVTSPVSGCSPISAPVWSLIILGYTAFCYIPPVTAMAIRYMHVTPVPWVNVNSHEQALDNFYRKLEAVLGKAKESNANSTLTGDMKALHAAVVILNAYYATRTDTLLATLSELKAMAISHGLNPETINLCWDSDPNKITEPGIELSCHWGEENRRFKSHPSTTISGISCTSTKALGGGALPD